MKLVAIALALAVFHGALRALGLGAHTSVIAGMPIDATSYALGPIYALSWIAFVTVAPILALTAALEAAWLRFASSAKKNRASPVRYLTLHPERRR